MSNTTRDTSDDKIENAPGPIRIDKWLWQARFFKSRSLAASAVTDAPMRLNGQTVSKASTLVKPGDVMTFVQARQVRVVRMLAVGTRRGPAAEAQGLYEDITPETDQPAAVPRKGARPTGKARRDFDATRAPWLE